MNTQNITAYSKTILMVGIGLMVVIPHVSFAALIFTNLNELVCFILDIFDLVIPILFGAALLFFFWGVANFILKAGESKEHAKGRQIMIWGIIALFCLVSLNGILQFLSDQLEFGGIGVPFLPTGGLTSPGCGARGFSTSRLIV